MNAAVEHLARAAYDAYGTARGWMTFNGDEMPRWEDQVSDLQDAWRAAATAVAEAVGQ